MANLIGVIPLYMDENVMDENVLDAITRGQRSRNVDVLSAQEDGRRRTDDRIILARATALKRVLFSQDTDLLALAVERQRENDFTFSGVVYAHQDEPVGRCIDDLELLLAACTIEEMQGAVCFLPLR